MPQPSLQTFRVSILHQEGFLCAELSADPRVRKVYVESAWIEQPETVRVRELSMTEKEGLLKFYPDFVTAAELGLRAWENSRASLTGAIPLIYDMPQLDPKAIQFQPGGSPPSEPPAEKLKL